MELNYRLKSIKPSPTLAMAAKANDMLSNGYDVINLSVGEPDYGTPDNIKQKACEAIKAEKTKYTSVSGIKPLKEAIVNKFLKENNLQYSIDEVLVGVGAKQLIFNAMIASLNDGDEVIIPSPYWVSYADIVSFAGGIPVIIRCAPNNEFKITASQIERAITHNTKWVIINSPNNPTGSIYSKDELEEIANMLLKYPNVYVLTDDIYEHLIFDEYRFYTIGEVNKDLKKRVLTINGVSKSYSMTGWRLGYAGGPRELINAMSMIQSQSTSNPCTISQYAALEALTGNQLCISEGKKIFQSRRDLVINMLQKANHLRYNIPIGAFYLFVNCKDLIGGISNEGELISSSSSFCNYLLDKFLVAVVDGGAFGMPGYFRISYAVSEDKLKKSCERIINACNNINICI